MIKSQKTTHLLGDPSTVKTLCGIESAKFDTAHILYATEDRSPQAALLVIYNKGRHPSKTVRKEVCKKCRTYWNLRHPSQLVVI